MKVRFISSANKGFPYALLYAIETDEILITAVAHLHRDPEHYKDRIV